MLTVMVSIAFKDDATGDDVREWLEEMQAETEPMDDAPQFLAATWAGNCYAFHDCPNRYAPAIAPKGHDVIGQHLKMIGEQS